MKKSVKHENHIGLQPIRVLKHNLVKRLEDRQEAFIKLLQLKSQLSKSITYKSLDLPLIMGQTPYINSSGMIYIHETYLSYLWMISFSMFVMYEEGIAIPDQIKRNYPTHKNQNRKLLDLTEELFEYAKSLVVSYSKWDIEYLPNPEFYDIKTEEGSYIEKVNDLYVEAMNFILFHEIAHAELEHIKIRNNNNLIGGRIKALELEADSRAINLLLANNRNIIVTELAIIVGLASILFMNRNLDGGKKHPNTDVRIENAIKIIKPADNSPVWAFLVLFVKLWDKQFSHNFIHDSEYENFKELYYILIEQAKKI